MGCAATSKYLVVAGGMSRFEVLNSVEVFIVQSRALGRGGSLQKARAYFQMVAVGSTNTRLLAIGGHNGTSTLDTSEWWEDEGNSWEEGPTLSTARANFAALMGSPNIVCSKIQPSALLCPASGNVNHTCAIPIPSTGRQRYASFLGFLALQVFW